MFNIMIENGDTAKVILRTSDGEDALRVYKEVCKEQGGTGNIVLYARVVWNGTTQGTPCR